MSEAGAAPAKKQDDKKAKGIELANARVPKAIKYIGLLGNLSNYAVSPQHVDQIVSALKAAVKKVEDRLRGTSQGDSDEFKLR